MPILNVKISGHRNPETTKRVASMLIELTAGILGKQRDVTAIAIDYVPEDHWFVGGAMLSEQNKRSFYFDIKVVEGTNTKDEMARYIAAAFHGFGEILGEIHPESYNYVQEVRSFAYGFGGHTQEHRYIAKKLSQSTEGSRSIFASTL
jgi:4-oxalocrotonate tautomerase